MFGAFGTIATGTAPFGGLRFVPTGSADAGITTIHLGEGITVIPLPPPETVIAATSSVITLPADVVIYSPQSAVTSVDPVMLEPSQQLAEVELEKLED